MQWFCKSRFQQPLSLFPRIILESWEESERSRSHQLLILRGTRLWSPNQLKEESKTDLLVGPRTSRSLTHTLTFTLETLAPV